MYFTFLTSNISNALCYHRTNTSSDTVRAPHSFKLIKCFLFELLASYSIDFIQNLIWLACSFEWICGCVPICWCCLCRCVCAFWWKLHIENVVLWKGLQFTRLNFGYVYLTDDGYNDLIYTMSNLLVSHLIHCHFDSLNYFCFGYAIWIEQHSRCKRHATTKWTVFFLWMLEVFSVWCVSFRLSQKKTTHHENGTTQASNITMNAKDNFFSHRVWFVIWSYCHEDRCTSVCQFFLLCYHDILFLLLFHGTKL